MLLSQRKTRILRWIPAALFMLLILFLSTQSVPKLPFKNADKGVHFMVYGILSMLVFWPLFRNGGQKRPYLISILAAVSVGIIDETIQHFNPARVASFWDLLSDAFGAACSVGIISRLIPDTEKNN